MSREIFFRVWDKQDGLQKMYYNCYFIPYGEGWNGGNPEYKFYEIRFGEGGFMKVAAKGIEIMQYTGLKDKTGKEIYEGDIVKWGHLRDSREDEIRIATVEINPDIQLNCKNIKYPHVFRYGNFAYNSSVLEIIGNIYQNPELLK